jgi:hypothetical protein
MFILGPSLLPLTLLPEVAAPLTTFLSLLTATVGSLDKTLAWQSKVQQCLSLRFQVQWISGWKCRNYFQSFGREVKSKQQCSIK